MTPISSQLSTLTATQLSTARITTIPSPALDRIRRSPCSHTQHLRHYLSRSPDSDRATVGSSHAADYSIDRSRQSRTSPFEFPSLAVIVTGSREQSMLIALLQDHKRQLEDQPAIRGFHRPYQWLLCQRLGANFQISDSCCFLRLHMNRCA